MRYSKSLSRFLLFIVLLIGILLYTSTALAANLVKEKKIVVEKEYTVQSSDTLWSLSQKYNIPLEHIKKYNNLKTDEIKKGHKLKLPDFKALYLIKIEKNDTLWSIAQKYDTTVKRLKEINKMAADTIYIDQHLLVIKDSTCYYQDEAISTQEDFFVNWQDKEWVVQALTDLVVDKNQKEEVKKEISEQENISRYELAVMLERILHKLDENEKRNEKNLELKDEDENLSPDKVENLVKLVRYLQTELEEMDIKTEKINEKTSKLEEKNKNLEDKTNNIESDVEEIKENVKRVDNDIKRVEYELDAEKNKRDEFTQIKLEGLTKLEWKRLIAASGQEERMNQILYLNIDSYLTDNKKMDFFFQALYDYIYTKGRTEIIIGAKGDFALNEYNKFLLSFAHQQPFNTVLGYKQTYFDLGWKLNSPLIDLNLLTAHTKFLSGENSLNSADITLKSNNIHFNANYHHQDSGFIPIEVGRITIPAEKYLNNYEEKLSFRVLTPLTNIFKLKGGYQRADSNQGPTIGIEAEHGVWKLDVDYNHWDKKSVKDNSIWAGLNYKEDPIEILVELSYDMIDESAYSHLKTMGKIDLTDDLFLDLQYRLNDIETSTTVGFGFKF